MPLTHAQLGRIVDDARTLAERVAHVTSDAAVTTPDAPPPTGSHGQFSSRDRLRQWCDVAAKGDWARFRRRLEWDGLDLSTVSAALATRDLAPGMSHPPWATTVMALSRVTATEAGRAAADHRSYLDELPFGPVWHPALKLARRRLLARLGGPEGRQRGWSEEAYAGSEHRLVHSIVELSAPVLLHEFRRAHPLASLLVDALLHQDQTPSTSRYEQFVQELMQDGLAGLFTDYPVLARLVALVLDQWVEEVHELLLRLAEDRPRIEMLLCPPGTKLGPLVRIQDGLSDPHRGRCVVKILTFASGLRVVYKPRSLALDASFQRLLQWCNGLTPGEPLRTLEVLDRGSHGWMEYVEHADLADERSAETFYLRAGRLLCLLYVLGATDCHHENVIASGSDPVLVDLETLVYHEISWGQAGVLDGELCAGYQDLADSVLRTGLLPTWQTVDTSHAVVDVSGLGGMDAEPHGQRVPVWSSLNTDYMTLGIERQAAGPEHNLPTIAGRALSPERHVEAIAAGFRDMYELLRTNRSALVEPDGPLASFRGHPVRFVVRATESYARLIEHSVRPEFLRHGVDRSIELDRLSRRLTLEADRVKEWPLLTAEVEALERLEIPLFFAATDSADLSGGLQEPITDYFAEPSHERILSRIRGLDEPHLELQLAMIRGSFAAVRASVAPPDDRRLDAEQDADPTAVLGRSELLRAARDIAQLIGDQAIELSSTSCTWMTLEYLVNADRLRYQPVDASLYDGACGIALFLAAYGRATADERFVDLALRAVHPTRQAIRAHRAWRGTEVEVQFGVGLGGMTGLGSVVYALATLAELSGREDLLDDAGQAARWMTPEEIGRDHRFDVMTGAAGALLALLALYRVTGHSGALRQAMACGNHLVTHRVKVKQGQRVWPTQGAISPSTGFAHGTAGIAHALRELYAATGDARFLAAGDEATAYETALFQADPGNWPDMRYPIERHGEHSFSLGWCNGAAGMCLSRARAVSTLPSDQQLACDLAAALRMTRMPGLQTLDHVCCGNFGRVEALVTAARELGRDDLAETAQRTAAAAVSRAQRQGGYTVMPEFAAEQPLNPGMFRGLAGIGYALLRLTESIRLPSHRQTGVVRRCRHPPNRREVFMGIVGQPNEDLVLSGDLRLQDNNGVTRLRLDRDTGSIFVHDESGRIVFHWEMPGHNLRFGGGDRDADLLMFAGSAADLLDPSRATFHVNAGAGTLAVGGDGVSGGIACRDEDGVLTVQIEAQGANIRCGGGTGGVGDGDVLVFPAGAETANASEAGIHLSGADGSVRARTIRFADGSSLATAPTPGVRRVVAGEGLAGGGGLSEVEISLDPRLLQTFAFMEGRINQLAAEVQQLRSAVQQLQGFGT